MWPILKRTSSWIYWCLIFKDIFIRKRYISIQILVPSKIFYSCWFWSFLIAVHVRHHILKLFPLLSSLIHIDITKLLIFKIPNSCSDGPTITAGVSEGTAFSGGTSSGTFRAAYTSSFDGRDPTQDSFLVSSSSFARMDFRFSYFISKLIWLTLKRDSFWYALNGKRQVLA